MCNALNILAAADTAYGVYFILAHNLYAALYSVGALFVIIRVDAFDKLAAFLLHVFIGQFTVCYIRVKSNAAQQLCKLGGSSLVVESISVVKTGDGKRQRLAVAKLAYRRVKSRAVQAVELAVERSKIRIFFTRTGQNARKQRICSSAFF